jgi:hypothetical protein
MSIDIKTIHSLPVTSAVFQHLGYVSFSAVKREMLYAVWESAPLDGTEGLISWTSFNFSILKNSNADMIYVYWKTSDTEDMSAEKWSAPTSNNSGSIKSTKRYLALRIVIKTPISIPYNYYGSTIGPVISNLTIAGVATENASLLFTKTYDLGFFPKSIVTTAIADVPDGSTLDIGITSLDSIDPDDYQFIPTGSVVKLNELAITGTKLKLMLRMSGSGDSKVVVHEFAAMFSGEGQIRLNQS